MGWERRGNRRYYTRSHKVQGRVVREYVGTGLVAELAAREDEERRRQAAADAARVREEQHAWTAVANAQETLSRVAEGFVAAALVGAGYHRHARGAWRKRRVAQEPERPGAAG
jgi:hypothetical protein